MTAMYYYMVHIQYVLLSSDKLNGRFIPLWIFWSWKYYLISMMVVMLVSFFLHICTFIWFELILEMVVVARKGRHWNCSHSSPQCQSREITLIGRNRLELYGKGNYANTHITNTNTHITNTRTIQVHEENLAGRY